MSIESHTRSFAALGNPLRLRVFRFVIKAGDAGRSAGDIARALKVPASTLSPHLRVLEQAGLVRARRDATRIIYRVNPSAVQKLVHYLMDDCCQGQPELCGVSLQRSA
jgi:ArsR family transcriptional regulator